MRTEGGSGVIAETIDTLGHFFRKYWMRELRVSLSADRGGRAENASAPRLP